MSLLKRLSQREKLMMYAGIVIFLGLALYFIVFEPAWSRWVLLNEQVEIKERLLMKNLKILGQKEMIFELYDKYAEDIKMRGSDQEEIAVILREIENVARSSSIYITDIKPLKIDDKGFYKEYYVELEAEGTISNLTKFIYDLQSSKQILKVRRLNLNAKSGKEDMLKGHMIVTKILIP